MDHLIGLENLNTPLKKTLVARDIQTSTWSDPPVNITKVCKKEPHSKLSVVLKQL